MLQPTRTKFRKAHKGRIHGNASRCNVMNYGAFGLKAIQPERVISKQIEASVADHLKEGKHLTYDLGGDASCSLVGDMISARLAQRLSL